VVKEEEEPLFNGLFRVMVYFPLKPGCISEGAGKLEMELILE
jgi:hypothetical protein